jgi:hypothetical protein
VNLPELLRPPPHRGPLIAAGAVVLATGVALEEIRLTETLGTGWHLAILTVCAALVYGLGVQAPTEGGRPPAYQSVLLVTGLLLLYAALLTLSDVLGADFEFSISFPAGAFMWTALLAAAAALWPAVRRRSAICAFLAAVLVGIALLSAWRWLFDADSQGPYRVLLLLFAVALVLCSLALRGGSPRHAEQMVNAAGVAILAIGLSGVVLEIVDTFVSGTGSPTAPLPNFWELVVLAAGFGLIAFGAVDRAPGPAWLGVANVAVFLLAATVDSGETLTGWPIALLLLGAVAMAAGLRPRAPLPPEPNAYRLGEQPLAARTDDEIVLRVRDDSSPR